VHEGEAIFHLAIFDELGEAESVYETFQSRGDPEEVIPAKNDEPVIY